MKRVFEKYFPPSPFPKPESTFFPRPSSSSHHTYIYPLSRFVRITDDARKIFSKSFPVSKWSSATHLVQVKRSQDQKTRRRKYHLLRDSFALLAGKREGDITGRYFSNAKLDGFDPKNGLPSRAAGPSISHSLSWSVRPANHRSG